MKRLYIAAWLVIFGFLIWSGDLLLQIQSMGSKTAELHELSLQLDSLAAAWRDLNRPGNDVLENYEVREQRAAFSLYERRYTATEAAVIKRVEADSELGPLIDSLAAERDALAGFAEQIFDLADERQTLRLAQADAELILATETAASAAMARMDQTFQNGLDVILKAGTAVVQQERYLEEVQRDNFQRLYIMLLVTLLVSALTLELIRQSMRQREALRDGAARISTIVNNVIDGIVTVDSDGRIESINQSAERMFGYGESQVVGGKFVMLLDKGCRDAYLDQLRVGSLNHVILTFSSDDCEGLGLRQDGSTFPIELAINSVTVKGEQLYVHIVRDVTERKQADQKQRLAASVFENATEGIVVTDVDGTIQSVNPAYSAITQYAAEELLGQNTRVLKSDKQDREFYSRMWTSISESGHWQGEIWNRRKNGEDFQQWLTIDSIKDNRGRTTNYVGVAWDITELKASQRMKEEFIATISHELRTPLTSVLGSLGMLTGNMREQLPQQAQRLITLAHSNSRRLVRLISDILDIEKIEAGKMTFQFEPVDLTDLVHRVIEDSKALAEQVGVTLSCQILTTDAWVSGDADRLMQAMTNLLSNAIKFSPASASVEVVLRSHDPMLRLEVTDHGPGIPEEFHSQIFNKFVQVGRSDKGWKAGTGLGLSIVKLIVRQHDGRIDFRSSPGAGTTFCVDLHRAEPASVDARAESVDASVG